MIPDGVVPSKSGAYKIRGSFGKDPLFHPLTEEQYQNLKNNPWITGFVELPAPWSKPDARRGIILYAKVEDVKPKIEKLIQWYNDNKKTMDPVELAAKFQLAFVSIHPFVDGNGRTSRLLMDRILKENGLPPSIVDDQDGDLYLKPDDYVAEVRKGIQSYLDLHKSNTKSPSTSRLGSGFGLRFSRDPKTVKNHPKDMSIDQFGNPEIQIGGQPFIFAEDGFFYSPKGIPYVYRAGDRTLYPISDQSYQFYFKGGEDYETYNTNMPPQKVLSRKLGNSQKENYRASFSLLKQINENKIDPLDVKIGSYNTITKANGDDDLFLYHWQKDTFINAMRIDDTDSLWILDQHRINQSTFSNQHRHILPTIEPATIIAQYEALDFKYSKFLEYAKKNLPDAVPTIMDSRRKIHTAARDLLKDYFHDRDSLSPEAKAALNNVPAYQIWNDYLSHSKLSYSNFDDALKNHDDSRIYLLRSDSTFSKFVGFRSQADYKKVFDALPGSTGIQRFLEGLVTYLRNPENRNTIDTQIQKAQTKVDLHLTIIKYLPKALQEKATNLEKTYGDLLPLLDLLKGRILANRFSFRGTSEEYQRAFVDFALHAEGKAGLKEGISFTTAPNLLVNSNNVGSGELPFTKRSGDASVFLVNVPKDKVAWNIASAWSTEYEVIGTQPISPSSIVKRYPGAPLVRGLPETTPADTLAFIKKYSIGPTLSKAQGDAMTSTPKYNAAQEAAKNAYENAMKIATIPALKKKVQAEFNLADLTSQLDFFKAQPDQNDKVVDLEQKVEVAKKELQEAKQGLKDSDKRGFAGQPEP
jgi:hypothetical protein